MKKGVYTTYNSKTERGYKHSYTCLSNLKLKLYVAETYKIKCLLVRFYKVYSDLFFGKVLEGSEIRHHILTALEPT
jgi:hypothetical protein